MKNLVLENHEIEKRLGYTMGDQKIEHAVSPGNGGGVRRRMIAPTRSSARLMRQVSGLGMEDPVFQTKEDGPEHPSNIFSDMGVMDIADDCLDMLSVASDHTAKENDGLDMEIFHMSLSVAGPPKRPSPRAETKRRRPSLKDFDPHSSLPSRVPLFANPFADADDDQTPRLDDTDHSGSHALQGHHSFLSSSKEMAHSMSSSRNRVKNAGSATRTSPKKPRSPIKRKSLLAKNHPPGTQPPLLLDPDTDCGSRTSLDLEGVFGASKVRDMRIDNNNKDTLLAEAAQAVKEYGVSCSALLIETAKQQHASCSSLRSAPIRRTSHYKAKQQPTIKEDTNEKSVSQPPPPPRPRVMPTLSKIFKDY